MLVCLVRPLGCLGLMAVASGVFARPRHRSGQHGADLSLNGLGRCSSEQIFELVRFVDQVSTAAIQQVAGLFVDSPVGVASFSTAAAMLLVRAVRDTVAGGRRTVPPR